VPDAKFEHPRLVAVYDAVEGGRGDLDAYVAIADELGARRVLDIGCGTGVLALRLAARGLDVVGVDPAAGSLAFARAKPGAERVRWIHGDAATLPPLQVDLATMTGNVAQAITDPGDWDATLAGARGALRPGGRLVFETRVPARREWEEWTPAATRTVVGEVETWTEVIDVSAPLVTFRSTTVFGSDGATLTSDSTLRFRERAEVEVDLERHGFSVVNVRDAPDRPGRELVFFAQP
jgi:SAM-dependent methyltransferase